MRVSRSGLLYALDLICEKRRSLHFERSAYVLHLVPPPPTRATHPTFLTFPAQMPAAGLRQAVADVRALRVRRRLGDLRTAESTWLDFPGVCTGVSFRSSNVSPGGSDRLFGERRAHTGKAIAIARQVVPRLV